MDGLNIIPQQEGAAEYPRFGKLATFYVGRFLFQHLVACQCFCCLLLVELHFGTQDKGFFRKRIVRIFQQFTGVEKNHIIVFLLVSNQAEIVMCIQAECSFRESLQIFVETCLGFFHPSPHINLFCGSICQ